MGQSLIIQGIVSKLHFHVNNSNYSIKHMTLGNWGGGGGQQIRCMDINNPGLFHLPAWSVKPSKPSVP